MLPDADLDRRLAEALFDLVGRRVDASVLAPNGRTIAALAGAFERAYELDFVESEVLVVKIGQGRLPIRVRDLLNVETWSTRAFEQELRSVVVGLADGSMLVVHEEIHGS